MILITAFEPFDGRTENNSLNTLNKLNITADKVILPVDTLGIKEALYKIDLNKYDLIIMLGEAKRDKVSIEMRAYNQLQMRIKDNKGNQLNDVILKDGPDFLETSLNIHHKDAIISKDAGLFLCNQAYYLLLHHPTQAKKLFIHVPVVGDFTKTVEAIIRDIKKTYYPNLG